MHSHFRGRNVLRRLIGVGGVRRGLRRWGRSSGTPPSHDLDSASTLTALY